MSTSLLKRLLGIVAVVALALGISLAGSTPAHAAGSVWDKVAQCESGGNWRINTGNGFYGGLQFSSRTWRGFGGGSYASSANRASKAEQIAIARRVLATQGPGAWPTCGRRAHLTKSNGHANRHATPSGNPGAHPAVKKVSTKAKTIRVKSGDTLARIAHRYSVKGGWRGLWKLNAKTVKNPNRIKVGQVLRIA